MEQNEVGMKVEIPSESTSPGGSSSHHHQGLTRQPSNARGSCLCSPTSHAGSFRCRLHRSPSLQRTKSMDPPHPASSKPETSTLDHN